MEIFFDTHAMSALLQVIGIDLVLAADNALVIGLAAAGLAPEMRRKAVLFGILAATIMRIGLALITTQLLSIVGLLLAGGILLAWVAWRMYRELRESEDDEVHAQEALGEVDINQDGTVGSVRKGKTLKQAIWQILIADVSMSLDNVLAVAGAAREHPSILIFGLALSVVLMGFAANWIAGLLTKYRWIGYVGLIIIAYVALSMMAEGAEEILHALGISLGFDWLF